MNPNLKSILVIDDDEPTNFFTQLVIEKAGCTRHVKAVQSGQEALDYLTGKASGEAPLPPDLIFLDINMPAMDGWDFLEKYKALDASLRSKVVVVMLTTSLFQEDRQKAQEMPEISLFENKPLTVEKLDRILSQFFAGA
jgi:CheY-like chemotaxis protein